jgi:hypothetical protein
VRPTVGCVKKAKRERQNKFLNFIFFKRETIDFKKQLKKHFTKKETSGE